jgi:hypothetical protein
MNKQTVNPWPSRYSLGAIAATITSIIIFLIVGFAQVQLTWTPLQRYYLPDVLLHELAVVLHLPTTPHRLVVIASPTKKINYAQNSDFTNGTMRGIDGRYFPFSLSDSAQKANRMYVSLDRKRPYETARIARWFSAYIFPGMSVGDFVEFPCICGGVVLLLGLMIAFPIDKERAIIRRFGRRMRGPEYVPARAFVRRLRADGVGFFNLNPRLLKWLSGRKYDLIRIPRKAEASGIAIIGATGSGKSALCFQLIAQILERGERLIVIDAALEFVERFFDPAKDIILNPGDQRTKAWDLASEINNGSEARTIACSMVPTKKNEHPFFTEAAQRVLAELLKLRPSTQTLSKWLTYPAEIDRRIAGTEAALMIDPHAGPQRVGVLATLAMFGEALRSLPNINGDHGAWSSAAWAKDGTGSIFLTFPPMMREQIKPLIGTWLDLLILRLQREGAAPGKKTWIIVDEMPTLGALPALIGALTENRKSGNPLVTCLQDKNQLDSIFGDISSTMLSMPATKVIFRTSEPNSAKWASQAIGNVEYEQLHETESTNPKQGHSRSEHIDVVTRPLVMPEELDGLPPLHGYLKFGNLVADLDTCYLDLPRVQPGFVPRVLSADAAPLAREPTVGDEDLSQDKPADGNIGILFE